MIRRASGARPCAGVLTACVVLAGCADACSEQAPTAVPEAPKTLSSALLGHDGRELGNAKAGAELGFAAIVGAHVLDNGMQLQLDPNVPQRLGVQSPENAYGGALELFGHAVDAAEGELDAYYYRFVRERYQELQADRATQNDPAKRVVGDEPRLLRIGELRGVRYGFSELRDEALVHRAFGYAFVQGSFLYGITGSAPAGEDADGSFETFEDLAAFEADAPVLLESLQLPAR